MLPLRCLPSPCCLVANPPPTVSVSDRRSSSPPQDKATRSRVETTLLPFLKLRSPKPDSIRFITDFSRRTGDLEVLSKPDIHLLALCYELEIERNGGDWRVRKDPRQKGLNGKPPATAEGKEVPTPAAAADETNQQEDVAEATPSEAQQAQDLSLDPIPPAEDIPTDPIVEDNAVVADQQAPPVDSVDQTQAIESTLEQLNLDQEAAVADCQEDDGTGSPAQQSPDQVEEDDDNEDGDDEDDDSDGWITPSNLKKHQAKDSQVSAPSETIQETLQAALLTSDFAMQNVALRINLKYVSPIIYHRRFRCQNG